MQLYTATVNNHGKECTVHGKTPFGARPVQTMPCDAVDAFLKREEAAALRKFRIGLLPASLVLLAVLYAPEQGSETLLQELDREFRREQMAEKLLHVKQTQKC